MEMLWKYLLLSHLLLERIINGQPSSKLRKVTIRDPEALCNDNTRASFYVRRQSSKNWVIFFESGGLCSSKESCNERYLNENSSVLMTSTSLPDRITGRDILSTLERENPRFRSYNHVLVPYCSSDLWLGGKTSSNKPFTFVNDSSVDNFSFRGKTIFRSVFEELRKNFSLSNADQIILAGSSAGAIGVINNADWILNNFIKSHGLNARMLAILDSSWFINFQDSFKSRVNPEFAKLANITFDACKDLSYGYACCLSSACMLARGYFPSAVPVLFVFSLYDIYMFADVLKGLEAQGKTPEDHAADFLSVVSMYGGAMNESVTLSASHVLNISFFVPACFQHTYFSTSSLWDEDDVLHPLVEVTRGTGKFTHRIQSGTWISTRINNGTEISLQQFISTWVESGFSRSSLIDSCIGAHCNPTCPDKLVFIDSGVVWHDTVKAIVIALSLVISVLCLGLKSSFIFYYNYLAWKQNQYFDDSETCQGRKELPLTRTDEAISIACLSLTYHVVIKKQKKPSPVDTEEDSEDDAVVTEAGRNASGSFTLADSVIEEGTGDDYQDFDTDGEANDSNMQVAHYTKLDMAEESLLSKPREERLESFTRADGDSTWEPASAIHNLLQDAGSVSCATPRSSGKEKGSGPLKKQILKGVSAYFNTGELVAIMGPSGCGKTTFLDLLTGRRRHGDCKGQVYINGVALGDIQDWYACKIGYVLQLAVPYYEELTVRQNLFFAAHMRLDRGTKASEKFERVEQILAETGLTSLAETEVGGAKGLGLSGGQKRRLCVALQMIHMPSVLFLDEPTSGLDATSSLELLNHLNLVAESGRLVILTIHQPRLEIFHLFHKILLLCDGQVAYYGEPSMAPAVFLKAYAESTTEDFRLSDAAPKIDAKNPADTIMDLLNCSQARRAILDYYQRSGEPQAVQEAINTAQKKATETLTLSRMANIDDGAGSFNRIFVLESRAAERQTLGQILYFPVIFFMFGIIIGTVYWHAEDRDGILLMSAYCVYCCASPLFLSSVLMAHLNKALEIFHLEREDGCGRSYENVIQTFVRATALCVFPVIVCSTMSYFMVMTEYDLWKFIFVTIISLVLNETWIAVYIMVICAQPRIAHRICPMVSAIGGFAGGFLVPKPQMPIVYNLLFYINPQFYGYSAVTKVLLSNVRLKCEYESTLNCISTDGNAVLSRFGFDKVNPYQHVVIMLAMTILSLILAWLFLEAKYVNLRVLTKRTLKFSDVKVPEDVVIVPEQGNDMPSKVIHEDEYVQEDIQLMFPEDIAISPFTRNRRSAKSRLGLISKNQGFHTVKLPNQKKRAVLGESLSDPKQDGAHREVEFEDAARPSAGHVTSASKRELWKSTRQRMEERKLNFNEQMTQVQNLATRFSIYHSQSLRRRAKGKVSVPRRSTMATAAFSDSSRSHLTRKHVALSPIEYPLDLVSGEVKNPRAEGEETDAVDMGDVFDNHAGYKDENDTTDGPVEDLNQISRTGSAELAGTDNNSRPVSYPDQNTGKDSSQPLVTTREHQRTRTGTKPKKTILKPRTDRASLADSTGSQESLSSQAEKNEKKKRVSIASCEITDVIDV